MASSRNLWWSCSSVNMVSVFLIRVPFYSYFCWGVTWYGSYIYVVGHVIRHSWVNCPSKNVFVACIFCCCYYCLLNRQYNILNYVQEYCHYLKICHIIAHLMFIFQCEFYYNRSQRLLHNHNWLQIHYLNF